MLLEEDNDQREEELNQLCQGYEKQGFSDLSMTKYKYLLQRGTQQYHSQIHPLIPYPAKHSEFLSSADLYNLDQSIIKKMEAYPHRERLFKNNSQHSFQKSGSIERSLSKLSDRSYGPKDEVAFRLDHNKYQMRLQKQLEQSIVDQYQQPKQNIFKKLPKIKSYPSRLADDGQVISVPKNVEVVQDTITIPTLTLNWLERFYGKWRPPMREGASLNGVAGRLYLYGGISGTPFNDMNLWDGNEWSQVECERLPFGRTNHCSAVYRRMIYYFGGEKPYDGQQKIRESLNDFRMFNTDSNEFKVVRISGEGVEGRRAAASCFVGKHLIVFGGITTKGTYVGDMFHLDTQTYKLALANIDDCQFFNNGIAFHTMVSVYNPMRLTQLYKCHYDAEELKEPKTKAEGVYLFGGESKTGKLNGTLFVLNTFQRPMFWTQVNSKGVSPIARYKHSCTYFERQYMLVIYGGIAEDSTFLSDCHIFKVDTQTWCQVNMEFREGRAGHCTAIDDNKLMLFGGYNQRGFVSSEPAWLELDNMGSIRTQRQLLQTMNTSKHEKIQEQKKKQTEEMRLQKLRQQIESLSFKNIKSFAPMPLIKAKTSKNLWGRVLSKKEQMLQLRMQEETQHLLRDVEEDEIKINKLDRKSITLKNLKLY